MERSRSRLASLRPQPLEPPPDNLAIKAILSSLILVATIFAAGLLTCQPPPCPQTPPCPYTPLIPAGSNFSWIEYIPLFRAHLARVKVVNTEHPYPAWQVFNASNVAASWVQPLHPNESESLACRRRIAHSYRQLVALWHPDRNAPPTNTSVGSLRRLLDLSNPQLSTIARVLDQAYNDAIFGCMTSAQKSTWLNTLTDSHMEMWDSLDVDDVFSTTQDETPAAADPSDLGLDLSISEYIHVVHCMERERIPWAVALHQQRQRRRSLLYRCRSAIESAVDSIVSRLGGGRAEQAESVLSPLWRAQQRQRVLAMLMMRTGALDGCRGRTGGSLRGVGRGAVDDDAARPWWERKYGPNHCGEAWSL